MNLRAATPRGWAICRWNVGNRLCRLLENGESPEAEWAELSTAEQEAACAEFLRERHTHRPELPVLSRLLMPVGRTLKDIDIYGLAEDGTHLYAQVTYHATATAEGRKKAVRLGEYAERIPGGVSLVFFGRGRPSVAEVDSVDIFYVSVEEEVMRWILANADYSRALFGTS
jgi:hypothetical protein